jgi:hypothetical protein
MSMIPEDDNRSGSASALSSGGSASEASDSQETEGLDGDGRAEASQYEKDARAMGWQPEEDWDGPPGKWVDARTFVERGEQILPILRANNRKMKEELLTRDKDLATLRESLASANKAISALKKSYSEVTKREVEIALADLREQFKQAREVGDVDLELKVKKNLDTLEGKAAKLEEENEEEEKDDKKEDKKSEAVSPEFLEWQSKNKWFGNELNPDDKARTIALVKIGERLRKEGEPAIGLPFMDKCMEILEEQEKGYFKPKSKVESGGGKSGGGSGRLWDNLPKEAKSACYADSESFVGPGKMFKTVKEWEDHYANLYQES